MNADSSFGISLAMKCRWLKGQASGAGRCKWRRDRASWRTYL